MKILSATILLALSALVAAKPNGSPICAADGTKMAAGMGGQTADLGFTVAASSMTVSPNTPITFTLDNSKVKTFKGLLMYVQPSSNAKSRVGTFTVPTGFQSTIPGCAANGFALSTKDSILTHMDSTDKKLPMQFTWMPTSDATGDLEIFVAVVGTGPTNYQVLSPMKLSGGSNTSKNNGQMGIPDPSMNNGGMQMKKCRRIASGSKGSSSGSSGSGSSGSGSSGSGSSGSKNKGKNSKSATTTTEGGAGGASWATGTPNSNPGTGLTGNDVSENGS